MSLIYVFLLCFVHHIYYVIASTIGISTTNIKAARKLLLYMSLLRKTKMSNTGMTNHTVVIKGATGGIGFQSALGIAKTRSDARIIIIGRNKERGEAAHTGRINTRFARPNMALNVFANSSNLLGRRGVQSKPQGDFGPNRRSSPRRF